MTMENMKKWWHPYARATHHIFACNQGMVNKHDFAESNGVMIGNGLNIACKLWFYGFKV